MYTQLYSAACLNINATQGDFLLVFDICLTTSDGFHFKWLIKLQQFDTDFRCLQFETFESPSRVSQVNFTDYFFLKWYHDENYIYSY